jgi:opacity protein-like surface antigen
MGAVAQAVPAYFAVGTIGTGLGSRTDTGDAFGRMQSFIGGGEGYMYKGLAFGGDGQIVWPRERGGEYFGLLSLGPSYHFDDRLNPRWVVPFVTGGYGLAFRDGNTSLFQWGTGVTFWPRSRVGVRVEYRRFDAGEGSLQMNQVRFSLAFRD